MSDFALEQIKRLADTLSSDEKQNLLSWLESSVQDQQEAAQKPVRKSLFGAWTTLSVTDADIDQMRQELWSRFPREDF